ncbi:MAG: peptidylprolyl isomerase [Planctomycetota bacterium]|nr:peptidylprolyl isomerase [Planctomycetota bacterium]
MPSRTRPRPILRLLRLLARAIVAIGLVGVLSLAGCSTGDLSARQQSAVADKPIAISGGQPIVWSQMQPLLAEAAGRQILDEIALDRELDRELASTGVSITDADVRAEQALLVAAVGDASAMDAAQNAAAIRRLREERGLGPQRFQASLRRSAALRRLSADQAAVSADELTREIAFRFGAAWRVRWLVASTASEAQESRNRIQQSPVPTDEFARVATERSIDPTASRGGLIERCSPLDPNLPVVLRQALASAKAGELSGILALDRGFGLVLPIEPIAARVPSDAERANVERALRLTKQRLAIDALARRLLERAKVNVLDASIGWRER